MRPLWYLAFLVFLTLGGACSGGGGDRVATPTISISAQAEKPSQQALRDALEEALKETSSSFSEELLLWYVLETRTLYWVLAGDYNLDGVVNISDVTPLATYFFASWNPPDPNQGVVPWWVDGTGDRVINIADIVPVADHFFNQAPAGWETSVGPVRKIENKAMWAVEVPDSIRWWEIEIASVEEPPPPPVPPELFLIGEDAQDEDGNSLPYRLEDGSLIVINEVLNPATDQLAIVWDRFHVVDENDNHIAEIQPDSLYWAGQVPSWSFLGERTGLRFYEPITQNFLPAGTYSLSVSTDYNDRLLTINFTVQVNPAN